MKRYLWLMSVCVFVIGCSSQGSQEAVTPKTAAQEPVMAGEKDLVDRALGYIAQKDIKMAVVSLREAIIQNSGNARAYYVLGEILMQAGQIDGAAANLERTVELDPNNGRAHFLLGGCLELLGKKDDAIQALGRSIEIFKANNDEAGIARSLIALRKLTSEDVKEEDVMVTK